MGIPDQLTGAWLGPQQPLLQCEIYTRGNRTAFQGKVAKERESMMHLERASELVCIFAQVAVTEYHKLGDL